MSNEPIIFTSKGNVLESTLTYSKSWDVNDDLIVFKEFWTDDQGAVVKNSVHIYALKGLPSLGADQTTIL